MNLPPAFTRHRQYKKETPWIIVRRRYGGSPAQPGKGQSLLPKHEPQPPGDWNAIPLTSFSFFFIFQLFASLGHLQEVNRARRQARRCPRDSWMEIHPLRDSPVQGAARSLTGCHCLPHAVLPLPGFSVSAQFTPHSWRASSSFCCQPPEQRAPAVSQGLLRAFLLDGLKNTDAAQCKASSSPV